MGTFTKWRFAGDSLTAEDQPAYVYPWVQYIRDRGYSEASGVDTETRPANWARSGNKPEDWIQLSLTKVQIGPYTFGGVDYGIVNQLRDTAAVQAVVLFIGANAISPVVASDAFLGYYNGTWSLDQRIEYEQTQRSYITEGWYRCANERPVAIVACGVPTYSMSNAVRAVYPDIEGQRRVYEYGLRLTADLKRDAQLRRHAWFDAFAFYRWCYGENHEAGVPVRTVGGNEILMLYGSEDPSHGFEADNTHPHSVVHGLFANCVMHALNENYGTDHELYTEAEIATIATLPITDGGQTSGIDYDDFVENYVNPGTAMSELSDLQTIRAAIITELAACVTKASYSIDGQSVSWDSHRAQLLADLEKVDAQIAALDPVSEISIQGVT